MSKDKHSKTPESKPDGYTLLGACASSDKSKPKDRECGVCWGRGEIDINGDMDTVKCWECGGTGRLPV